MVLTVDSGTTLAISRNPEEKKCEICSEDSTSNCSPEKTLTNVENLKLEFSCLNSEDVYNVKVEKKIGKNCRGYM